MNAEELEVVRADAGVLDDNETLAAEFYRCLFALDPSIRELFPEDMAAQQRKLVDELNALVELGLALSEGKARDFADRAGRLGASHRGYGARPPHYELVGTALLQSLESHVDGWDEWHRTAWSKLYWLVAQTMLDGAG